MLGEPAILPSEPVLGLTRTWCHYAPAQNADDDRQTTLDEEKPDSG